MSTEADFDFFSVRNACLMFLIWLSITNPTFLSLLFDISVPSVHYLIRRLMPIHVFLRHLKPFIKWPLIHELEAVSGIWSKLPIAVGSIDGTSHEIYRPIVEPQDHYYSGHRQYHAMYTYPNYC